MIGPFADNDLLSLARFLAINLDGILTRAKEVSQVVPDLPGEVVPDLPGGDLILENAVRDGQIAQREIESVFTANRNQSHRTGHKTHGKDAAR